MKRLLAALSLLVFAAPDGLAQSDAGSDLTIEGIAATVNDKPISYSDVRQRAQLLLIGLNAQPDQDTLQRITVQAREQLIEEQLQLQKTAEFEIAVDDSDVRRDMEALAESNGTDIDTFYAQLLAAGINPASLEEQTRVGIAWRRLMQGLYGSRVRVSDAQIDDRLRMIAAGSRQMRYQLAEIFIYAPQGERREQAGQFAATLLEQLNQGAPFQIAAQRFSVAATAATGGDMGWVSEAELEPEVTAVIAAMPGPGYTPVIAVDNGFYIYAVRGKQEPQASRIMTRVKQLVARDGSRAAIDQVLAAGANCDNLETLAAADDNLSAIDIGTVDPATLNEENRTRIESTPDGSTSEPFTVRNGLAITFVCGREEAGIDMPTREQVENQLYGQQLARISERELRNIKREATIVRR